MEALGEVGQHALGPLGRIGSMFLLPAVQAMRAAGFQSVQDLRAEALLHPEKMSALLESLPTTDAGFASRLAAIKTQLAGHAALSASRGAQPDERKVAQ
jgi:hypothetical protein